MSKVFQNKDASTVGKCLSLEELTKYVNGELTEKEKFSFENHLVECELCTDAIEGFSFLSDQATLTDVIDTLQSEISSKSGYKPSKLVSIGWKRATAIAATLVLLCGVGFMANGLIKHNGSLAWFNPNKEAQSVAEASKSESNILQADQKSKSDAIKPAGWTDDGIFNGNPPTEDLRSKESQIAQIEISEDESIEQKTNLSSPEMYTNAVTSITSEDWTPVEGDANGLTFSSTAAEREKVNKGFRYLDSTDGSSEDLTLKAADQNNSRAATAPAANGDNELIDEGYANYMQSENVAASKSLNVLAEKKAENKKDKAATSMESAMNNYNSANYRKAANDFESLVSSNPGNRKATYHAAVSNMNLGRNNKALPYFDNLIDTPGSYTESAKWLKAQVLIKKNKKSDARTILQEIANGNGKFSDQAFDLLQKL